MKFKLDENFGYRTQKLFREANHDVSTVLNENLHGCKLVSTIFLFFPAKRSLIKCSGQAGTGMLKYFLLFIIFNCGLPR